MSSAASAGPQWFKRAQRGLFAGKQRLSGNHVSPSKRHVRRVWLPNVQHKNLWSDTLGRHISINVTTAALREIDRAGGVDNYLLNTPDDRLASSTGARLRKLIIRTQKHAARVSASSAAAEAASTGSPASSATAALR